MDISFQIQGIKSQIDNMKLQIENIEMNFMNPMSMFPTGEQLLNLSMQLFNAGVQVFNTGKTQTMIINNKYTEQLKTIPNNINNILNSLQLQQMQPQMMQQQPMMMAQQMMQLQNMEQPMINSGKINKINFTFHQPSGGLIVIVVDDNISINALLDKYMEKVYGYKLEFQYFGSRIRRNDSTKLRDFFKNRFIDITVFEY